MDYFGDNNAKNCGECDNCLVGRGYQRKTDTPARKEYLTFNDSEDNELETEELRPRVKLATKLTQLETFELYNKGMFINEMAQKCDLKPGTIVQHLCYLIEKGLPVEIDRFVSLAKQKKIIQTARKVGLDKLAPIKDCLGEEISYDEIKLTMAKFTAKNKD